MYQLTETFFDKHNGEIVVVTRLNENKNMVGFYGKYCTGPYNKEREYFFRPCDVTEQPR